jgi:cell division protein FtsB
MTNIHIKRIAYKLRRDLFTINNFVILVAFFIVIGWVVGSINALERNYALQQKIVHKQKELKLSKLELATLQYEQNYYKSDEYKELAARDSLGLVLPGEKVLVLPPNSKKAINFDKKFSVKLDKIPTYQPTKVEQWIDFFSGKNVPELN